MSTRLPGGDLEGLTLPALPRPLRWLVPAPGHTVAPDGALAVQAGGQTDWFSDPGTGSSRRDAPALVMPAPGAWQLSALVSVEHRATFDAGVLFLYLDAATWAKLCLERSPNGETTVVSVVTRGTSDDCNSVIVAGHSTHLRVSCLERAFAFHHSIDGRRWSLVRYFSLGEGADDVAVGFVVQSPTGDGCTATFSDIVFRPTLLEDLRSGA
jgi:regulation of enolase protein 1 (concanavalin A-like superfamily)